MALCQSSQNDEKHLQTKFLFARRWNPDNSEWFAFPYTTETPFPAPPIRRMYHTIPQRLHTYWHCWGTTGASTPAGPMSFLPEMVTRHSLHPFSVCYKGLICLKQGNRGRKLFLLFQVLLDLTLSRRSPYLAHTVILSVGIPTAMR